MFMVYVSHIKAEKKICFEENNIKKIKFKQEVLILDMYEKWSTFSIQKD